MSHSTTCNKFVIGCGLTLLVLGLSLGLYGPTFFSNLYQEKLELSPTSTTYQLWRHTPLPLYLEVYLFNWTNAQEFIADKSVVPHFEEVGPFIFREVHDRVNVVWNDNNTVTYNQTRKWTFISEASEDLSVKVTNLNVIATTISHLVKRNSKIQWVANFILKHMEHFTTTSSAKNWLFDGIEDPILDSLVVIQNILHIPASPKKFGWFYGRNMSSSYDGIFTVRTGSNDIFSLGVMDKWNRMNKTKYYDDECGMVNGTSGELFPPMKSVPDTLTIFVSDICSSITLNHTGYTVIEGLDSYSYAAEETTLDNGELYPENKCFCRGECAPYGARDVSKCRMEAPLFFSFPHFYLADDSYRNSISGMIPNSTDHEFIIQLDKVTGIPTNVKAQLQINVLLEPVPNLSMFENVPKLYIPMMWFRQRARITPDLAYKALMIDLVPKASIALCYGLVGIGSCMILFTLFVIWRRREDCDEELLVPPVMDGDNDSGVDD